LTSVDESFLAGLGIHRIATPVPFIEAGGPANAYAIEDVDGGFTLFDCACGTEEGLFALRKGIADAGLELKRLNRIIVSHGHVDHYGNAQTLAEESGCQVFVHANDEEKVAGEGRWYKQLQIGWSYFQKLGVPEATLEAMLDGAKRSKSYARPVDRARLQRIDDGARLKFRRFEAQVMHLPGHTPGLLCLWVERNKLLFADDHVLAKVSPNPLLDLTLGEGETKFKALVAYCESARRVRDMEIDCVLPGHGEAFAGHRELLDNLFGFYAARQSKLLKRLSESPATIYELLPAVFARIDVSRMYLMLSEVLANIEVLEAEGKVKREVTDVFAFSPA
jgi:glyoxylase-like metal-dependent hydrolase (beta-lactamase superfamily II)